MNILYFSFFFKFKMHSTVSVMEPMLVLLSGFLICVLIGM